MAYNKKTWITKEIITKEALNNIEDGIATLDENQKKFATKEEIPSIAGLATEEYVDEEIAKIDVTNQLTDYAKTTDIPTKTSQLTNDSNFLISIPSEYITETELEAKGYLTEHQDISGLATKEEIPSDYVKTVNGVSPNADGNVTISATLEPPTVVDSIEEMVDTSKQYVLSTDGFIYGYRYVEPELEEEWTNVLSDVGYQQSKRVNSSGELVTYTTHPVDATNHIPCKPGDEVRLEGFSIPSTYTSGTYYQSLAMYREDKTWIKTQTLSTDIVANKNGLSLVEENGYIVGFTLNEAFVGTEVAYIIITSQDITLNSRVLMKRIKGTVPNFTNLANTDGTDWMMDQRISTTSISASDVLCTTNAISAKRGDTVYFKNVDIYKKQTSSMRFGMWSNGVRVNAIDDTSPYYGELNGNVTVYENGVVSCKLVKQITGEDFETEFDTVRFSVAKVTNFADVIITVNEPITYSEATGGYEWASTGISYASNDYSNDIAEIKNDISDLENIVSSLGNSSTSSPIPNYWVNELNNKVDTIQQVMESVGRNKSSFYWYTDAHWQHNAKKSPLLLDYLIKNTPINKVNFGGDIVGDPNPYDHENIKSFYDWQKAVADIPNHHSVYGNHDLNHWTTDVHNMSYSLVLANEESDDMVVSKVDGCYYIDNPSEKTRYLYLSYLTKSQTDMMTQGQFIVDSIKSVKSGWHIVVIAHRWFQYSKSSTPTVGSVPSYESEILSILDAYNMRTTRAGSNYFYEQDFTECKGVVEFCIGGHIHVDYDFTTTGGIPVIITASDTNQERAGEEDEDCGSVGTITEQALYSIIADYENRKVHVIGVGRGGSRELPLLDIEIGNEDDVADSEVELATIDDTSIRNDSTWSSSKIHNELSNIRINANTQNLSSTPNYVVTEAQNIADKVIKTRNAYSIVISGMSDLHTTGSDSSATGVLHAFQGINEIDKFTPIDLVAIHGDVMVGYMTDEYQSGFKYVRSCMNEITKNVPLIQMQGNHDDLSSDTTEVARQRYFSYIGANNEGTVTDFANRFRNYGYKDFDDLRIRFIYLNSADASEVERTSSEWITPMQFNWFVNTALDFSNKQGSEDWQWIVACHHPLNTGGVTQYLLNILKAYTTKTSGSFDLYHLDVKHTISYDFTNVKQRFICHLHGHIHNFRTEWFDDVLSITVPNACYGRNNEYGTYAGYSDEVHELLGDIDENGQQRQFNKTSNTANDTAFVTFVIDSRVNNKIYAYCYGAGIDREIDLTTKEVLYIEKETIEPDTPVEPDGTYTNLIPTSIDTDGTIFNGVGYKTGYRISSSGSISVSDMCITGFIDVEANQTIRLKNVTINGGEPPYVAWYNQDKSFKVANAIETVWEYDSENDLYIGNSGYNDGWLRISCHVIDSTSILTINEDIPNDDGGDTPVEPSEPINLLVMSNRTYESYSSQTSNFIEVTVPHELDVNKYYPAVIDGRVGKYCGTKITHTVDTTNNGFAFSLSSSTGYGLLFPIEPKITGEYLVTYTSFDVPVVIHLVEYNANNIYKSRTQVTGGLGGDGKQWNVKFNISDISNKYALFFSYGASNVNKTCTITNLSVSKKIK